jgi:SAM-dependent methyltransferase
VLAQLFDTACRVSPLFRRFLIRTWFQYLSRLDKEAVMPFMNFGYVSLDMHDEQIISKDSDSMHRYCIAMYRHVAGAIDLEGLDVLEVGSGRGGGAAYIMRALHPRSMTGVDIAENAVTFCNTFYQAEGLRFLQGDAESLPFDDETFHAIVNIESSYGYGNMERFLQEVFRVLRPNGYFLFADYRPGGQVDRLRQQFLSAGFIVQKEESITANVIKALELDCERKVKLIQQKAPQILHTSLFHFAATPGSKVYEALRTGVIDYRSFVLHKR